METSLVLSVNLAIQSQEADVEEHPLSTPEPFMSESACIEQRLDPRT